MQILNYLNGQWKLPAGCLIYRKVSLSKRLLRTSTS